MLPRVNRKNDNTSLRMMMTTNQNNDTIIRPIDTMKMGFLSNQTIQQPVNTLSLRETVNHNNTEKPREMLWGQPTWFLLHTLAEKVNNETFFEIRSGLLNIIYIIVTMLPCPICAAHGKTFLDGINFNTIITKENLKYMLFDFHNLVNSKKHFTTFLYPDLVKYDTAITNNIIQNFMFHFTKNSGSIRLIADDLYRKRMTVQLKQWFNENIKYFAP